MKVGIIGAGSIGLLLSCYLARHHQVTLYVKRQEQLDQINENGIELGIGEERKVITGVRTRLIMDLEIEECLFICVKQPQLDEVLSFLRLISPKTILIFLQNGMGHLERINNFLQRIIIGVVEHGATRKSDYQVEHLGCGKIRLAPFKARLDDVVEIVNQLHQEDFPFDCNNEYDQIIKEKLIVNAVLNPLTALFDVENGEIITNEHIRFLAKHLNKEAAKILQLNEHRSWKQIEKTAKNTAKNTSSMRADLKGNRETEINAISGYLLQHGFGNAPYTTFVYHAILGLEKRGQHHANP